MRQGDLQLCHTVSYTKILKMMIIGVKYKKPQPNVHKLGATCKSKFKSNYQNL